jgi:hypothetical protein
MKAGREPTLYIVILNFSEIGVVQDIRKHFIPAEAVFVDTVCQAAWWDNIAQKIDRSGLMKWVMVRNKND